MSDVVTLRPVEVSGDGPRLPHDGRSEDWITLDRRLEMLTEALSIMSVCYVESDFDALSMQARDTSREASELGFARMARVARTISVLSGGDDMAALAANIGRLGRLGDEAIGTMWDLQDRRG